jgi:hypothetical protein
MNIDELREKYTDISADGDPTELLLDEFLQDDVGDEADAEFDDTAPEDVPSNAGVGEDVDDPTHETDDVLADRNDPYCSRSLGGLGKPEPEFESDDDELDEYRY